MVAAIAPADCCWCASQTVDSVFASSPGTGRTGLHVQYMRRIRGGKLAGTPGRGPFPSVYDKVVSWRGNDLPLRIARTPITRSGLPAAQVLKVDR